jgi:transmembrane sensor
VENAIDLQYFLQGYMAGTLSDKEKLTLFVFLDNRKNQQQWESLIGKVYEASDQEPAKYQDGELEEMIRLILRYPVQEAASVPVRRLSYGWWKYAAAAVVILFSLTGYFLWNKHERQLPIAEQPAYKNDVMPGGNHAVLTLANGAHIILDSVGKGNLGVQGGSQVIKINAGSLTYKTMANDATTVYYNSIATPAGGQYQVMLADGTQVWLNALSSLKFPTSFHGTNRTVEVTGEAYFEVAKDVSKPFIVHVNGAAVEVFGTHFNVMAYNNESALETTLLEGSIKFRKGNKTLLLKPGQQSKLLPDAGIELVNDVNTEQVVAWKNGMQSFNSAGIRTIMRQVERWYDIQVEYKGDITTRKFSGDIPREAKLSELLNLFKVNKIHFDIDAGHKKMIVMP